MTNGRTGTGARLHALSLAAEGDISGDHRHGAEAAPERAALVLGVTDVQPIWPEEFQPCAADPP